MITDETIRRVLQFRDDRDWRQFHTPKDLAISLNLECAELLELFQWSGADLECRDKLPAIADESLRHARLIGLAGPEAHQLLNAVGV